MDTRKNNQASIFTKSETNKKKYKK
jgi:hypothetical protein